MAIRVSVPGLASAKTIETVVTGYGNQVYKLAYHLTGSVSDAEDIVQETFLKLFRSWTTAATADNLNAWIYRVVTNAALDLLRSRQSRSKREKNVEDDFLDASSARELPPERRLENSELGTKLEGALDRLPPQQRTAIILFDHEGLSGREISKIMGVSETTVRTYVCEGRRRVRELMKPYLAGRE
jgi:RNA polymerase sigma-70 factor (ECF subfamily)